MADRIAPTRKTPVEILAALLDGHREASYGGPEKGKKYLQNFIAKANSIPNAVKFYLYDLLVEDAFRTDDLETCQMAVSRASDYLAAAQEETLQRFREYSPAIRFIERGIALAIDAGEFEQALALGLGKMYAAKRASIERML